MKQHLFSKKVCTAMGYYFDNVGHLIIQLGEDLHLGRPYSVGRCASINLAILSKSSAIAIASAFFNSRLECTFPYCQTFSQF